ncbi:ABC transporter, permease protein [Treponema primitia ZAS-2]|uniref:ABC transporter, permease protein n=1 Tax=Treponema primitia (strain ATCC BAA-887 / DSM 12427 / ZAS-2) TaxID=545694 RepID=F5YLL0_TREPZ|nr:ABC transporter permease [Treponema primitia]AEF86374.1 ABC transporter, permease protein [Treponema primitia ZAS-2]
MSALFSSEAIRSLLQSAAPLMLGSLGALFTEISGSLGIFIEGFMSLGSFFSWIFTGWMHSAFWGIFFTALLAALIGWALARFVHLTGANPFIAALAMNLAAGGITETLSILWFGTKGVLRNPAISLPKPLHIPLVENIPFIGNILSGNQPSVYLAWGLTILAAFVVGKTRLGLRLRAAGLSAEAASERGIRPERYREGAWAAAAFLAALAGAALSFRVGVYAPGGVAGRGWICLAAVFLGFRRVWGTLIAALVFALAERIGLGVQSFGALPATVVLGLPSALALVLYTLSNVVGRVKGRKKV